MATKKSIIGANPKPANAKYVHADDKNWGAFEEFIKSIYPPATSTDFLREVKADYNSQRSRQWRAAERLKVRRRVLNGFVTGSKF